MGLGAWWRKLFRGQSARPTAAGTEPAPRAAAGQADGSRSAAAFGRPPAPGLSRAEMENARISVTSDRSGSPSATFIRLEGVLNSVTAEELEEQLQSFIENGEVNLVVDFSGVPYVSSRGWGILISVVQAVRKSGGDIKIAGMCPNVLKLFVQTGLSSIFEIYEGSGRGRILEEEA